MADSTPSPSPTHTSSAPKINGSEGAFVAIVVVLGVVFVLACVGIFLLLRFWEPNHHERERRRKFSIRRKEATRSAHPLPIGLHDPEAPVYGSLTDKLGNMFRGRRQGSGWVQTHDDDWDSGDEMTAVDHDSVSMGSALGGKRTTIIVEPDDKGTIEGLSASPMQVTPSGSPRAVTYSDPFEGPVDLSHRDDMSAYYSASSMASRDTRNPAQGAPGFLDGTKFKEDV
ncbi:hypothetical protein OF83DRAFT_689530 [Amylostereum chailletii]|nr:hypothetical protein OF83DRAFT_689530 [Amylostereum chailletii]